MFELVLGEEQTLPLELSAVLGTGPKGMASREQFSLTLVVHPIDEREALGLELGGGDGLHVTSLNEFTFMT